MTIHGVDGDEYVRLSNMMTLYEEVMSADKVVNY